MQNLEKVVLLLSSVGEMTLRLYTALSYSQNSARDLRCALNRVLALFTVGDVYASLCKKGAYAPFSAKRRSRALFWL